MLKGSKKFKYFVIRRATDSKNYITEQKFYLKIIFSLRPQFGK